MKRVIDLLFIIGFLVNLTKGADLVLRPSQQKWIQNKMETIALWLDYSRPLKWYRNLSTINAHIVLALPPVIICSLLSIYLFFTTDFNKPNYYTGRTKDGFGIILLVVVGFIIYDKITYPATQWLVSNGKIFVFIFKYTLVSIGLSIVIYILSLHVRIVGTIIPFTVTSASFDLVSVFMFGASILLIFIWIVGSIIFLLVSLILIAQTTILLLRSLVWRIVEYNKGAWAALTLIGTIILGIIDLYLKVK